MLSPNLGRNILNGYDVIYLHKTGTFTSHEIFRQLLPLIVFIFVKITPIQQKRINK